MIFPRISYIKNICIIMSEFKRLMVNKIVDDEKWNQMEKLYDNFRQSPNIEQRIPKVIHLIWLGKFPDHYKRVITKIKALHTDWEIKLWDETQIKNFGPLINQELYDTSDNLASKSDIFRYEILAKVGGIYMDLDFDLVQSFQSLLSLDFFAGVGHVDQPEIFNSIMGSVPNGDIIVNIVNGLKHRKAVRKTDISGIMSSTGPYYISQVFFDYLQSRDLKNINAVIFPTVYFFPYPAVQRHLTRYKEEEPSFKKFIYSYVRPETYCIHLWHTAWQ